MITTAIETVTPDQAREYLNKTSTQRPCSDAWVRKLADRMTKGVWRQTGEPIQFDEDGHLINGQHRLKALVHFGQPLELLIVRGLPHEAFHVMDQGKKRSGGDALAALGIQNYNMAAMGARILLDIRDHGQIKRNARDNSEIIEFVEKHLVYMNEAVTLAMPSKKLISPGMMSVVLFMALHVHETGARKFAEQIATGIGLQSDDPAYLLRERFMKLRMRNSRGIHPDEVIPFMVTAWNAFIEGRKISVLRSTDDLRLKGDHHKMWTDE